MSQLNPEHRASTPHAVWQLVNSFIPLLAILYLMHLSIDVSIFLTILLALPAVGFYMRIFIIQHDCGHGSFTNSKSANNTIGLICSAVTLIPYYYWRKQHAIHHATTGNLDRRGHGDITMHTVAEFSQMTPFSRWKYRFYRNPIVLLLLGPIYFIFIDNRLPRDKEFATRSERLNVHLTNFLMIAGFAGLIAWFGWIEILLIAGPILFLASSIGIWLFYVQHQFDDTYWRLNPEWKLKDAALGGSSFLKLPKLLQWFTGNIGFHHIHHLHVNVPNYHLESVYSSSEEYRDVHTLTLLSSLKVMMLSLWDEEQQRLISFREARQKAA